jgi:hypothetical protein
MSDFGQLVASLATDSRCSKCCNPCNRRLQPLQHNLTGKIVWGLELELFTPYLVVSEL